MDTLKFTIFDNDGIWIEAAAYSKAEKVNIIVQSRDLHCEKMV
jgi:hypothetical protein